MADTTYESTNEQDNYNYNSLYARRKAAEQSDIDQAEKYISLCRQKGDNSYAMVFI